MNAHGQLFVIDGTDGTGKNTQATLLYNKLKEEYPNKEVELVSFPRYGTPGCTMVEKYLSGEFGMDPSEVDPYTASMFYTIDRSISFHNDNWGEVYRSGGIVVADRYYTSNMIHQGAKILMKCDKKDTNVPKGIIETKLHKLSDWIVSTECNKLRLPKPDIIAWLIANKESNENMLTNRAMHNKNHKTDIHESNIEYLDYCRKAILYYQESYNQLYTTSSIASTYTTSNSEFILFPKQVFINVNDETMNLRSRENIHDEIIGIVNKSLILNGLYPKW